MGESVNYFQQIGRHMNFFAVKFGYDHLPIEQQETLTKMIEKTYEIGSANLYGGYKSEFSLVPLVEVINIMNLNNIELPNFTPFSKSRAEEEHGWGRIVQPEFFRA
jgi:hypothetical protein